MDNQMTPKQQEAIKKHGEQLNTIFHTGLDPATLCKKLRRIEGAAHRITTDYCNGGIDGDQVEKLLENITLRLFAVLELDNPGNPIAKSVIINLDPRGYALKIDAAYMRAHNIQLIRDLGGYGILAPEINETGE